MGATEYRLCASLWETPTHAGGENGGAIYGGANGAGANCGARGRRYQLPALQAPTQGRHWLPTLREATWETPALARGGRHWLPSLRKVTSCETLGIATCGVRPERHWLPTLSEVAREAPASASVSESANGASADRETRFSISKNDPGLF